MRKYSWNQRHRRAFRGSLGAVPAAGSAVASRVPPASLPSALGLGGRVLSKPTSRAEPAPLLWLATEAPPTLLRASALSVMLAASWDPAALPLWLDGPGAWGSEASLPAAASPRLPALGGGPTRYTARRFTGRCGAAGMRRGEACSAWARCCCGALPCGCARASSPHRPRPRLTTRLRWRMQMKKQKASSRVGSRMPNTTPAVLAPALPADRHSARGGWREGEHGEGRSTAYGEPSPPCRHARRRGPLPVQPPANSLAPWAATMGSTKNMRRSSGRGHCSRAPGAEQGGGVKRSRAPPPQFTPSQ